MNNADRIRAMTDEELAHQIHLARWIGCGNCLARKPECDEPLPDYVSSIDEWCESCWLNWLKQEVKE